MIEKVKEIAKFSDNTYGSRRMKKMLNSLSFPVSRQKARQLMKEAGVWVRYKKKYKVTTNSDHNLPVFDNKLKMTGSCLVIFLLIENQTQSIVSFDITRVEFYRLLKLNTGIVKAILTVISTA